MSLTSVLWTWRGRCSGRSLVPSQVLWPPEHCCSRDLRPLAQSMTWMRRACRRLMSQIFPFGLMTLQAIICCRLEKSPISLALVFRFLVRRVFRYFAFRVLLVSPLKVLARYKMCGLSLDLTEGFWLVEVALGLTFSRQSLLFRCHQRSCSWPQHSALLGWCDGGRVDAFLSSSDKQCNGTKGNVRPLSELAFAPARCTIASWRAATSKARAPWRSINILGVRSVLIFPGTRFMASAPSSTGDVR